MTSIASRAARYPYSIENGSGERITFLRRIQIPTGDRLEVENQVRPGVGPPMHAHNFQEEVLTVRQGRIGYQVLGEGERFAGVGEIVSFAPGIAHRFWNAGDDDLVCTGHIQPADNIEFFLAALFDSQRRAGSGRPDPFEAAFLTWRYRHEFTLYEAPAFVRRFVFPIVALLGRALGRTRRYVDAPEPVRGRAPAAISVKSSHG